MIVDEAEALLDPVSDIDGFMLACLIDASTGMVLASRKDQDDISLPTAAAGPADIDGASTSETGESRAPNRAGPRARPSVLIPFPACRR